MIAASEVGPIGPGAGGPQAMRLTADWVAAQMRGTIAAGDAGRHAAGLQGVHRRVGRVLGRPSGGGRFQLVLDRAAPLRRRQRRIGRQIGPVGGLHQSEILGKPFRSERLAGEARKLGDQRRHGT